MLTQSSGLKKMCLKSAKQFQRKQWWSSLQRLNLKTLKRLLHRPTGGPRHSRLHEMCYTCPKSETSATDWKNSEAHNRVKRSKLPCNQIRFHFCEYQMSTTWVPHKQVFCPVIYLWHGCIIVAKSQIIIYLMNAFIPRVSQREGGKGGNFPSPPVKGGPKVCKRVTKGAIKENNLERDDIRKYF